MAYIHQLMRHSRFLTYYLHKYPSPKKKKKTKEIRYIVTRALTPSPRLGTISPVPDLPAPSDPPLVLAQPFLPLARSLLPCPRLPVPSLSLDLQTPLLHRSRMPTSVICRNSTISAVQRWSPKSSVLEVFRAVSFQSVALRIFPAHDGLLVFPPARRGRLDLSSSFCIRPLCGHWHTYIQIPAS
jgi:hypothetical protein